MTLRRILVPTDFSVHADAALAYAMELAQPFNAAIYLLHVVENPLAAGVWSSEIYTAEIAGLQINLVRDAEQRLRESIPVIAGTRAGFASEVRTGNAADEIVQVARERLIDLIVMGTHGRSALPRMIMGSVAERVTRAAPCPVLTLRADATTAAHRKSA
jgi:nucleotide-binding universal stress UspA family protein